jgi:hypothetical protein
LHGLTAELAVSPLEHLRFKERRQHAHQERKKAMTKLNKELEELLEEADQQKPSRLVEARTMEVQAAEERIAEQQRAQGYVQSDHPSNSLLLTAANAGLMVLAVMANKNLRSPEKMTAIEAIMCNDLVLEPRITEENPSIWRDIGANRNSMARFNTPLMGRNTLRFLDRRSVAPFELIKRINQLPEEVKKGFWELTVAERAEITTLPSVIEAIRSYNREHGGEEE